jgi:hypothetical protein
MESLYNSHKIASGLSKSESNVNAGLVATWITTAGVERVALRQDCRSDFNTTRVAARVAAVIVERSLLRQGCRRLTNC